LSENDFPIRDQRGMLGASVHDDLASVDAFLEWWASTQGFVNSPLPDGRPGVSIVDDQRSVSAYVSDNRWVANCPHCRGGIAVWSENPHGVCLDCGHRYAVDFPPPALLDAAVEVLESRAPENRHWDPQTETVASLVTENVEHGDPAPQLEAALLETPPTAFVAPPPPKPPVARPKKKAQVRN
jgi:Zn ribbon nucleic-acid-binding protein